MDKSVLVENRPLVKFIQNYIRDSSGMFPIIILSSEDIDDIISRFYTVVCAKILFSI